MQVRLVFFIFGWDLHSYRCNFSFAFSISYDISWFSIFIQGIWIHFLKKGVVSINTWWRHQMETFSALLALCAGNSPVPGVLPAQRPVTRNFDVFFDLHPNKRISKQCWGWLFETPSSQLWRHCNARIQCGLWHNQILAICQKSYILRLIFFSLSLQ